MAVSMILECKACHHVFGAFRPRCPVCGEPAPKCKHGMPEVVCAVCTGKVRAVEQKFRGRRSEGKRTKQRRDSGCIVCDRKVKLNSKRGTKCPHCDELIHKPCLELHRAGCLQFQFEREAELKKLEGRK